MFSITADAIEVESLSRMLNDSRAGAVATFEGRVRNHNDGRDVIELEYEAYESLADREAGRIIEEAKEKFEIYAACCAHRVGKLAVGDVAVWVGVSAAHRREAFEACQYIIDEIKHRLPVWKRERYADGSIEWVNCQARTKVHSHD